METEFEDKEERKVGITEFISQGCQIPAITKYLFSDFIVNQIDKMHNLVTLSHKPTHQNVQQTQNTQPNFQVSQQLQEKIKTILGEEPASMVEKLYYQLECGERVGAWQVIVEKDLSKQQRKNLHDFVREELHFIESQTLEGSKIKLRYNKNMRKMDPRARQKYTYFTMYKHGVDTFNALFRLSKITGISQKLFSTAGLKDKRGHTTQRVSVYNTDLPSLRKFYKEAGRCREMWIEDFKQFQDEKIEVGGLSGNQFGLILRMLNKNDEEELLKRVESLKTKGMINYFGLQRFGQFATKTYELGILYARREWKQLVESIILSDCNNFEVNNLKRQFYQSKKYGRAQKALQNKYKIEKSLFRGLSRFGENFQNVFESLPRSVKTLYTHSLQSYIWNRLASRRLREGGLVLLQGDMVGCLKQNPIQDKEELTEKHQDNDQQIEAGQDEGEADEHLETILVTADNINKYTISDLVLPLVGPLTRPQQGTWLQKCLREELDSLNLTEADFLHSAKSQNASAGWRRMLVKPEVLEHEMISHQNGKEELQSPFYNLGEKIKVEEGQLRSLRIVIKLPKSAYATMAIREMIHISSEFDVQRHLNSLYEQKFLKET